jgi:hypothetical protein
MPFIYSAKPFAKRSANVGPAAYLTVLDFDSSFVFFITRGALAESSAVLAAHPALCVDSE